MVGRLDTTRRRRWIVDIETSSLEDLGIWIQESHVMRRKALYHHTLRMLRDNRSLLDLVALLSDVIYICLLIVLYAWRDVLTQFHRLGPRG